MSDACETAFYESGLPIFACIMKTQHFVAFHASVRTPPALAPRLIVAVYGYTRDMRASNPPARKIDESMRRRTPEQRLQAFLSHCRLLAALRDSGRQARDPRSGKV